MKELFANTWAEMDQGVRIFLIAGDERALVIDTGVTGQDIQRMISSHTDLPCTLLNTHADRDHISSNGQFDEFYMHPSEVFLYHGQNGSGKMIPVFDGDKIDLGGRILEIVHIPGHTPGSIAVLDSKSRCLIGGDPIQEDGDIFMFGQHRDMEAYIAGLERLARRNDIDYIYPSHAKEKVGFEAIQMLINGARRVLEGTIEGKQIEKHGHMVNSYDAGISRFLCDF